MPGYESVTLKRTCEAIRVPSGEIITLFEGTHLSITQTLGGNYTVVTDQGSMASIAGKDGDALGKPVAAVVHPNDPAQGNKSMEDLVWDRLKTCYDPEIPHNIVDLGLIYQCKVEPVGTEGGYKVAVDMTLTAPGCGMGEFIRRDAEQKILSIPGVKEVRLELVFDPPWDPSRMNPALRRSLNMM